MKLYISPRTPNPRRVTMFIAEKGITGIEVALDLMAGQHRDPAFLEKIPWAACAGAGLPDMRVLARRRAPSAPTWKGMCIRSS